MREYPTQQLIDDIARSVSPEEFDAAVKPSHRYFDAIVEPKIGTLACREGCSLCCSLRVDLFAHEVFPIARHILTHFTSDEIADLRIRLAGHAQTVMPLTPLEHATTNVRCPLLIEGRCTVYEARPHSCRRHHSRDFSACQFTFDHPTDLQAPAAHDHELFLALTDAMQENINAYSQLGFDETIYELGTALNEALNDPASWQRWFDRGRAFRRASVTPAA